MDTGDAVNQFSHRDGVSAGDLCFRIDKEETTMNLKEGPRRLALLLGILRAIFRGLFSYGQLQATLRKRADHKKFAQIAVRIG
jgi:hypothetical protein